MCALRVIVASGAALISRRKNQERFRSSLLPAHSEEVDQRHEVDEFKVKV